MLIIDASDAIVGRLAAFVAKTLLKGEEVQLVNVEKAVFSCTSPRIVFERYFAKRALRSLASPELKSPSQSWSRRPDFFFRRILRGMLPKHSKRGRDALRRFRAWVGVPHQLEERVKATPPIRLIRSSAALGVKAKRVALLDVCRALGWRG